MQEIHSNIKGAIFDVDGTLLDSMPIWKDAAERWLRGIGITPEEDLGETLFRMSLEEGVTYLKKSYFSQKVEPSEPEAGESEAANAKAAGAAAGESEAANAKAAEAAAGESEAFNAEAAAGESEPEAGMTEAQIREGVLSVIRRFYEEEAQAKPGARDFLAHLRDTGIPMYLATSSDRTLVRAALERLGLYSFFDGMITCEEAGAGKNEPQIFLIAAEQMGLAAAAQAVADTAAAQAAAEVAEAAKTETASQAAAEAAAEAPEGTSAVFVFEDTIHAVRAANSAGFVTVGVYDEASEADNAAMRSECGIYLHSLKNWDMFKGMAGI